MEQVLLLLILLPLIGALVTAFSGNYAKHVALFSSIVSLALTTAIVCNFIPDASTQFVVHYPWIGELGIDFHIGIDGISIITVILTNVLVPLIILAGYKHDYRSQNALFALILFMQSGLLVVFTALDAFLFYIGWEAALIPIYFICAVWGGKDRIKVNMKFFVYTIAGSLFMLLGIIYLYLQNPANNFDIQAFYNLNLDEAQQGWIFWAFFIAFAIKMPIFPFHTWQPDAYEQSPTATTMVLSGVMVKMGIFAVIKWLLPFFPAAADKYAQIIIILSVTGMLYASLIAIRQDDIKRLIAYSSIAHIGLMSATLFTNSRVGLEGVMIQMFNHGVNVIGLWIVADTIEQQLGTRKFSDLGGLAQKAPTLAIMLLVMAFANIALPLTNAFIGEFLMFNGLFSYNIWIAAIAGISIILAAVYTLNMVQKVFYGNTTAVTANATDISGNVKLALVVLVLVVIALGVYPQPMIDLTKDTVGATMAGK
ncbi:MAG TPA: NADH-quinone oxidoreductase subunit M [Chitinophagaceae bacterium]|nr:NADH-quinone oxidoreductase subunit M [Chitinophagaceae bacterium]